MRVCYRERNTQAIHTYFPLSLSPVAIDISHKKTQHHNFFNKKSLKKRTRTYSILVLSVYEVYRESRWKDSKHNLYQFFFSI